MADDFEDFFPHDDEPTARFNDPLDGETDFQRDLDAATDFGGFDTEEEAEGRW